MATTRPTVRTLDQIISELGTVYEPQVKTLQSQIGDLPNQIAAEEQGLAAKQQESFGNILSGAQQRGTGIAFGGIPLGEQAKYTASTYMPALAQLRTAGKQQATSLQSAINEIRERQQNTALSTQQYETQRADAFDTEQRQLAAQQAASAAEQANLAQYFTQMAQAQTQAQTASMPKMKTGKNFGTGATTYGFTYEGQPITAAEYVEITNLNNPQAGLTFRGLLQEMANSGDINAKIALNYVGDDAKFNNAPQKYAGSLGALGATGSYKQTTNLPGINYGVTPMWYGAATGINPATVRAS